jgi:hypothetical protein
MRHATNWAGVFSVAVAVGTAFFAGQAIGRREIPAIHFGDSSEASDAPPIYSAEQPLPPPQLTEDLTCPSVPPFAITTQSIEPPLADGNSAHIRLTDYSLPIGERIPPMPYITDEPVPAFLPHLTDVSDLPPAAAPDPESPLFRAVRKFVDDAARIDSPAKSPDKR